MNDPFDALRGNETLKTFLKREIERNTLSHAYILEGAPGTGKHTAARAAAEYMARDLPERRKIARGICPDVMTVSPPPDKKQFNVDTVREMKRSAYLLPNELPFKIFILEKTETMNVQAQNAALKILEEPPENTYFFLLCENASALLPTVRSRAPVLRMERFSDETVKRLLCADPALSSKCTGDRLELAVKNCAGSYGAAVKMLEGDKEFLDREPVKDALKLLRLPSDLLIALKNFPKSREEADAFLQMLQTALRDLTLLRSGGEEDRLLFFFSREEAEAYGKGLSKKQLFMIYDRVSALRKAAERNINLRNLRYALYGAFTNAT